MSLLVVTIVLLSATPALAVDGAPAGWTVTQITYNTAADEWPHIDATNPVMVWQQTPAGQDSEIWAWNFQLGLGRQLTFNDTDDLYPKIYGDAVVWQGRDADGDWEIYLYRFSTDRITKLTNNLWQDTQAQINGYLVVWVGSGPVSDGIYVYNIITGTLHTPANDLGSLQHPQTDGSWVVWQAQRDADPGGDFEIECWDGTTVRQVTDNDYDDYFPEISHQQIVWEGQDDGDSEVFYHCDGVTTKLTNNTRDDSEPFVDVSAMGATVGWRHHDGTDWEVHLASRAPGSPTWTYTSLTDNTANDLSTDVAGRGLVWFGGPGNSETYVYLPPGDFPTGEVLNLSNSPCDDRYPRLGNEAVVWQGRDSAEDWEIFLATHDVEPPVTNIFFPADGAVLSVSPAVISGEATDNVGVMSVQVSIDGFPWEEATIDSGAGTPRATWRYDWSLPMGDGRLGHVIYVRALDEAGNAQTSTHTPVVYVDRMSPVIVSFAINGGAAQTDSTLVTLTYTVTDGSPLMRMRFSNDGTTWSAWEPYAPTASWTVTSGPGIKTVWCSFEDVHGHVAGDGLVSDTIELVPSTTPIPPPFPDVQPGDLYYDAIVDLATREIILGKGGLYLPNDPVWRQHFAKMIVKTMGVYVPPDIVCPFIDVDPTPNPADPLYPAKYVAVCYLHGITQGKTLVPLTFAPTDNITRWHVMSMVVAAVDDSYPGLLVTPPADFDPTWNPALSPHPKHAASAARAEYNGLLAGIDLASLNPGQSMTRGEIAQVLHNILAYIEGAPPSSNHPPLVDAGLDKSVTAGSLFQLSANFTDADASDTHTAVASVDGVTVDLIVTEPTVASPGKVTEMIRLSAPGGYVVTFTVTDNRGSAGSDTMVLTVTDG